MESLLVSTGVVALAEVGDKTQLLAFILAARFKKPVPIILGILLATIVNHGLAGALGAWITSAVGPEVLRWVLGLSFIGIEIRGPKSGVRVDFSGFNEAVTATCWKVDSDPAGLLVSMR